MAAFGNNKRAVESILVASGDQALVNGLTTGGTLPGGGIIGAAPFNIPLMNVTNAGRVNLNNGQLGIFGASAAGVRGMNNALKSTDTFATSPAIYIAQGTSTSQTPGLGKYPLIDNRPYETSGIIYGHNATIMSGKAAFWDTSSVWSIGRPVTGQGSINTEDLTEYSFGVSFAGYAQDTENPVHARLHTTYHYKSPEYSTLGLTDDLDHLTQHLAFEVNRNSRLFRGFHSNWGANDPVVAFAIGLIANGAEDLTAAGFDNGGNIDVFVRNGVQAQFPATAEQIATLRAAIPALYGVINIDLTTAGSAADAEWFDIMALDRDLAYEDRVPQVKITLGVGLRDGFTETVNQTEEVFASEGEGKSRIWQLFYENTHGQRKYYQYQRQHYPFIEVPSNIVANTYYNVIVIEHMSQAQIDLSSISVSPKKTIILVPACDDTTMTSLLAYLNAWVQSTPASFLYGTLNATTGSLEIAAPAFC